MSLTPVSGGRHVCPLPCFIDVFDHASGEILRCDGCGRFWRLWIGSLFHDWERVGWWESRKIRRVNRQPASPEERP